MAGPAYVNFPVTHVQGLSNAYITHADYTVYNLQKNLITRLKLILGSKLRLILSKKADEFIFQTEEARKDFVKKQG